ncbi:bifunctional phosphopantothenoylcysteine decarboxylase/phosphopantothenate--cysteine ligase CoaBC [Anaerolineales bacterium HSG25]|nr:bifunctional phosphopantothenoylcysteine decarboxylase/phosphopantothenate--cysteine ligase CoaBC [Anaerolineales bacterium HSG25]
MMADILAHKHIILGITGGIAAYKAATLCSRLVQAGATVDVVMTEAAQQFITPLTFQALTHRRIYHDIFDIPDGENIPHISLADQADLLIIAPATTNTLAKLANGLADNLLTTIALATPAPILVAPAMETDMWQHPATQSNMAKLEQWGVTLAGPAEGRLASGAVGRGRMVEPEEILDMARLRLAQAGDLAGCNLVVTAGGTRETIDPVRFISNHSTGKMGYAIAHAARDRGAKVTLISTASLSVPIGVALIPVDSAQQMRDAVMDVVRLADVLIMSAAVADFRPATVAEQKIKKKADSSIGMSIDLVRTPDILADVATYKNQMAQNGDVVCPKVTIGFAAESENLLTNAEGKLKRKNLDMIAANNISASDAGFGVDTNRVTLLMADGKKEELPLMSKRSVAEIILDKVMGLLH